MKDAMQIVLSVFLGLLLLSSPCFGAEFIAKVVGVIDGDTLDILHNRHA